MITDHSTATPPSDVAELLAAVLACGGSDLLSPAGSPLTTAPQLLARVRDLTRLVNAASAELARTVRAADCAQAAEHDGHTTMRAWLRGHVQATPAEAAQLVRAGRTLERLPAWAGAATAGLVTPGQTAVVARAATPERLARAAELGADLAAIDTALLDAATGASPEVLPAVVKRLLDWIDPDGPEPDPTAGRELHLSPSAGAEGGGSIHGRFDAIGYEKVATALTAVQQAGRVADDDRSHAQQMGDALVQLADLQLAAGELPMLRKHRPQVVATLSAEDLLDPDTIADAARLGSGQVVANTVARQVACDSDVVRVLFGPSGMPLDIGRTQRLVPAHIRRSAEARDGHCAFAGCSAPTWWCDAHHVAEWIADNGPTSVENTVLLCERHHTKMHHGFAISWDDEEHRWRTRRPDGTEIRPGLIAHLLLPDSPPPGQEARQVLSTLN